MFRVDPIKLEEARNGKGKSQGDLGKTIGISQGAYSTREKTGTFSEEEVIKICKYLGIKKEQIQLNVVNDFSYLINKAIQTESALKVILSTQAEILAKLTNGNVTKIRIDLESVVDNLSKQALEQLGK